MLSIIKIFLDRWISFPRKMFGESDTSAKRPLTRGNYIYEVYFVNSSNYILIEIDIPSSNVNSSRVFISYY